MRDDVRVVDVAGGARAEPRVEGGRERAIADAGRSDRAHASGRREAVRGEGGERRAEAVAAEPDRARRGQRGQLVDERRPDTVERVPEPLVDRAVRRAHQPEAGVVERIPEPILLGAAEGDDDGARHRGDVRLRVAALDELGRQAGGGEALPRLVRIPVGEQRRFGEPPGVGSRHRRGARVERHGLVAVEVAIAGVGLGMEDEPKVGIGARSLHG